ncbi:MAG: TonB-dependent receptor [Bryobacteraceae bacterium]
MPRFILALAISFVVLFIPATASAQALYGTLTGNVSDPSGAPIAGAQVNITNTGTNQTRETTTGPAGNYSFANLDPGAYTARVTATGFQTHQQTNVVLTVNRIARVDARLTVGIVSEAITVAGNVARLQTEQSEVRYDMGRTELDNVPVPVGRNYQYALRTVPGVIMSGGGAIRASNPAGSATLNVNGTSQQLVNTRIDGASTTNNFHQHLAAYIPALEAIETVEVITNSFDADQALAGGAAVNVSIRSGTNDLHGSAFEYHSSNRIKARPFFFPADQNKPKFIFNQFGGTAGGPIKKDKLFYFVSFEGTADRSAFSRFTTVPSSAAKRGDLSETTRLIYDPLTGNPDGSGRQAFAGNRIPASRISGISQKLIPLWPEANTAGLANNYFVAASSPYNRQTFDTKINWMATKKFTTWGRVGILTWDSFYPTVFGPELGGRTVSGQQSGTADGSTYTVTLAGTYLATPSFIIDGYFGWTQGNQNVTQERLDEKVGLDFLGIPGTNGPRLIEGGWPRIEIDGYDTIGVFEPYMPWFRHDPNYEFVTNLNWTKGTHNIRFGLDLSQRSINHAQPEVEGQFAGGAGGFRFMPGVTEQLGSAVGDRANSFSAFLLGYPQRMGRTLQLPDEYTLRSFRHSYYVRDHWNVTPRLTLNYGARWECIPFPTRADRGVEFYEPDTNRMLLCGLGSVPTDCGVTVPKNGLSPRVGLAYRATDSFVIRAGYGITIDPFDIGPRGLRTNYPILIGMNLEGGNTHTPVGQWADGIPEVPVPDLSSGILNTPTTVVVHSVPQKIERGYIQSWNLTLQKEFRYGFVAQAGYVATRSVKNYGNIDINAGQVVGAGNNGRPLFQRFRRTAVTSEYRPLGTTQYNSLQASLQRRFSEGLHLSLSYTWSKAIGITADSQSGVRVAALDYFDLNRTLVNYDRTHIMNAVTSWELPFGRGRRWGSQSRAASAVLGGWKANGILTIMTGTPISVTASGTSLNMPGSTQRADQVKPLVETLGGGGRGQSFFDPLAFSPVTAARFGTAGFNSLRGPGAINLDFGLFRQFTLTERLRFELRMEAFNFTNTPHFANPGTNVSSMSFNSDGSIRSLGGFTEITAVDGSNFGRGNVDERTFRIGLRFSF